MPCKELTLNNWQLFSLSVSYMVVYAWNYILEITTLFSTNATMSKTQQEVLTSTPNNTTLRTPGISANAASTSGNTIENLVLGRTSFTPVKSISWTVLPRPLGYCSVTITGIPKIRAPCNWEEKKKKQVIGNIHTCVYECISCFGKLKKKKISIPIFGSH